ncbi:MAG: AraC family transcriptional regulator ligand-binding domain-containing protein [Labilithrix sp.]
MSGLLPAALFDLAGSKGVDCASLAREVDIRQSLDPDDRVPLASVLSLWATLIARFPSDPLGLELAVRWRCESLGLLGYLTANARSLGEALERFIQFQAIVDGENRLAHSIRDGVLIVTIARDPALSALRQPVEALLASGHAFFQLLSETPLTARRVRMAHASTLAPEPYRAFFGVAVEFEAPVYELRYDAAILDFPVPRSDPRLGAYLLEAAEAMKSRVEEARSQADAMFPERVAREVRRRLAVEETILIEPVARALGTSVRALQRTLGDHGTSYRNLLDVERRRMAELLLASTRTSVAEVASTLGFAEIASFSRAFKRWTSTSPASFRRRAAS